MGALDILLITALCAAVVWAAGRCVKNARQGCGCGCADCPRGTCRRGAAKSFGADPPCEPKNKVLK